MSEPNKNVLVSVVIPIFNGERFIASTIESVSSQSYKNVEIIVVNDGSSDGTEEILKRYQDKITLLFQKNAGQSSARNYGIKKAKGQFIALLDADDLFVSNKLEKQMDLVWKYNLEMCCSEFETIDENNAFIRNVSVPAFDMNQAMDKFLEGNFICTSTMIFKKDLFDKLEGFDVNIQGTEDGDLWFRMLATGARLGCVRENLLKYRIHSGNYSGNFSKMILNRNIANRKQYQIIKVKNIWASTTQRAYLARCYAGQLCYAVALEVLEDIDNSSISFPMKLNKIKYKMLAGKNGNSFLSKLRKLKLIFK